MMKHIAVYGGAFDPPHFGHLQLIQHLSQLPGIDEVWLMPCGDRADKKLLLSKAQRFALMRQLFQKQPRVRVSEDEIEMSLQEGRQIHTYDLLKAMRAKHAQTHFHFVVGADVLETIHLWGNAEKLQAENPFIVFHRKGYPLNVGKLPGESRVVETELPEVSSSEVKKVIGSGRSGEEKAEQLSAWLPEEVLAFLRAETVI
jgi:nicotinate-nucleotide adenylyltransferase